jgi:hypothetical protein
MKKIFFLLATASLFACNDSKKNPTTDGPVPGIPGHNTNSTPSTADIPSASTNTKFIVDGKEIELKASLLVQKDKKQLKPGNDYLVVMTTSGGPNKESLILNFLIDLKPGTYPVVGRSFIRGDDDKSEMYGGILGGDEKLTDYNVNVTECKDLGSNNLGGHKWSISGTFDEMTIPAMGIMLMDKTKNHPAEIKIGKGSFNNIIFDDNWEEMFKKGMEMLKKNK